MKALFLVMFALVSAQASAACTESELAKKATAYTYKDSPWGTHFETAKIHGVLNTGEKMNIQVSVDDFDVQNTSKKTALAVSLYGSSIAIETTFWFALVDAKTCAVLDAYELLGTGGGGL